MFRAQERLKGVVGKNGPITTEYTIFCVDLRVFNGAKVKLIDNVTAVIPHHLGSGQIIPNVFLSIIL